MEFGTYTNKQTVTSVCVYLAFIAKWMWCVVVFVVFGKELCYKVWCVGAKWSAG